MIIYNVLQHYYDNLCSLENWSLLLTSPLVEDTGGARALRQSVKKYNKRSFKDVKFAECYIHV